MRRVLKYGGTSLATPGHFERAARAIASMVELGEQVAVVVSAMGDETDQLIEGVMAASGASVDYQTQLEILCLGEEKSTLMMVAALQAQRVPAVPFSPRRPATWPIVVDSDDVSLVAPIKTNEERSITVRTQKTANRFARNVLPLMRLGQVPVIAGFVAVSSRDDLVTLGRGGSDMTAVIVASFIDADEVVLVTDVAGVMSADPLLAENPRVLENLSPEDAHALAKSGSRIVHPQALKLKPAGLRMRVVDFEAQEELTEKGTTIEGEVRPTLFRNEVRLAMLSVVGTGWVNRSGLLAQLADVFSEHGISISAASVSSRFISFYVEEKKAEEAHRALHEVVRTAPETFTSLSLRGGIGELRLRMGAAQDTRAALADITQQLSHRRIEVVELVTSLSEIHIFVSWEELDDAYEGLLKLLKARILG